MLTTPQLNSLLRMFEEHPCPIPRSTREAAFSGDLAIVSELRDHARARLHELKTAPFFIKPDQFIDDTITYETALLLAQEEKEERERDIRMATTYLRKLSDLVLTCKGLTRPHQKKYDVAQIKESSPIETIMSTTPVYRSTSRDKYLCPLHHEKTPSFTVFKDANAPERFYCFGCNEHGDVITLYQKLHGTSFIETLRALS